MSPLLRIMGRGAIAGGLAGLLSTASSFVLGEPFVQQAINLETAGGAAEAHDHGAVEPGAVEQGVVEVTRDFQHWGLVVASLLVGLSIGLLFGLVYAIRHRDDINASPWSNAIRLALVGFIGVSIIPFIRYPANPPAVGDAATIDQRTTAYLLAVLIGLATVTFAWQLSARLAARGVADPLRQLATVAVVIIGLAATFLLPDNPDAIEVPATLIWNFRLASITTIAVLWFGVGAIFGLIGERANRQARQAEPVAVAS